MGENNRPVRGLKKSKKISSTPFPEIIDRISLQFQDCPDFVLKKVCLSNGQTGYFLFLETLAAPQTVSQNLIRPLLDPTPDPATGFQQIRSIATRIDELEGDSITDTILSGAVILILEGEESALSLRLRQTPKSFPEPETEKVLNGPHEGFSADLQTNLALIRNKLVSTALSSNS